jgi:chemotaxis protein MotB
MFRHAPALVAVVLLGSGCVWRGTYDAEVEGANEAQARARTQIAALEGQVGHLNGQVSLLGQQLTDATAQLDAQAAAAKADLQRLRREKAATEARAALFHDLAQKLEKMVDAGDLRIVLRGGRMVLQLPNDVLFDTASTDVKVAGRNALEKIAAVLKTVQGHAFQVAGDTDNVPIDTVRFPSNWELSSARALAVVHLLIKQGMEPTVLSAAGYGQFDPIAPNDNADGRSKNRRTEITLQPNIEELMAVPEAQPNQ